MTTPSTEKSASSTPSNDLSDLATLLHDPSVLAPFDAVFADWSASRFKPASMSAPQQTVGATSATAPDQWNLVKLFGSSDMLHAMLPRYNGAGVHVAVYDDGIDKSVHALMTHYDASRELIIDGVKADPDVSGSPTGGVHGTAVAGIIAADPTMNNGRVTGLAYGAFLTAVNTHTGPASIDGWSATKQMANFDVTSNSWESWKWTDIQHEGRPLDPTLSYLAYAGTTGRGGLGTIIVKASGNDWATDRRDVGAEAFSTDRHVVTVGAIDSNDTVSSYSNRGAALLTCAPSSGADLAITTTDRPGPAGYAPGRIVSFGGTSAAAPEVAAVVADMLGANAKLGARDVQAILALASHDNETKGTFTNAATGNMAYGWTVNHASAAFNGGGYHFSNDEGFGELNAHDAIREAAVWSYMNPVAQTFNNETHLTATASGQVVPATATGASFTFRVTGTEIVENANLTLHVATADLNNLTVVLTGPSGTRSIVLDAWKDRPASSGDTYGDEIASDGVTLTLGSHAFLGEKATGTWTARVIDTHSSDNVQVKSATLDLYGAANAGPHVFHYTDEAAKIVAFDPGRLVLRDPTGTGSWIDTAMMTGKEQIDLRTGHISRVDGTAFLKIAPGTVVNKLTLGDGACTVICNDNGDTVVAGNGSASIRGGAGNDTFIAGSGTATIMGGAGADTFVFDHVGFGSVKIADFATGRDHLDLRGLGTDLSHLVVKDRGGTTTISNIDAAGDTIVLTNLGNSHLKAADFLFI